MSGEAGEAQPGARVGVTTEAGATDGAWGLLRVIMGLGGAVTLGCCVSTGWNGTPCVVDSRESRALSSFLTQLIILRAHFIKPAEHKILVCLLRRSSPGYC